MVVKGGRREKACFAVRGRFEFCVCLPPPPLPCVGKIKFEYCVNLPESVCLQRATMVTWFTSTTTTTVLLCHLLPYSCGKEKLEVRSERAKGKGERDKRANLSATKCVSQSRLLLLPLHSLSFLLNVNLHFKLAVLCVVVCVFKV